MKIEVNRDGVFVIKEIFGDTVIETKEGNRLAVCLRDDTVEMCVAGKNFYRADMKTGEILQVSQAPSEVGIQRDEKIPENTSDPKYKPSSYYRLESKVTKEKTIAYYYYNPDAKCYGFGFNTADGAGFLPEWDVSDETVVTHMFISEKK